MSEKTNAVMKKSLFFECLADVMEYVERSIQYHDNLSWDYYEKATEKTDLNFAYVSYKKQEAKKECFIEILNYLSNI